MFSFISPSLLVGLPFSFFLAVYSTAHYPHVPFNSLTLYEIRNPSASVSSCLPLWSPPYIFTRRVLLSLFRVRTYSLNCKGRQFCSYDHRSCCVYNTIFFCFYSIINWCASTGLPNFNLLRSIFQTRLLFHIYSRSSVSDRFPQHFPCEYLERLGRRQNPTLTIFSIDICRPLIQILLLAFLLLLLSPLYRIGDSASPCLNLAVTTSKIFDRRFTMLSNFVTRILPTRH